MLLLGGMLLSAATLLACRLYGVRRLGPAALLATGVLLSQADATLSLAPVVGLVVGFQLERQRPYGQTIAAVALPGLAQGLFLLWEAHNGSGAREELIGQLVQQLEMMGLEMAEDGYTLRDLAMTGLRLRPGTEFISLFLMAVWAYRLSAAAAHRLRLSLPRPLPLALWRPWTELIWVLVGGLALKMVGFGFLEELGLNLVVVMLALYAVQGLAVFRFFAHRLGLARPLELLVYVLLAMTAGFSVLLLAAAGLLDTWFDWRRLERPKDSAPDATA